VESMAIGLVTLCRGYLFVFFAVFKKYLELFRRDVMWRERKVGHKVRLCRTHGPERGKCISTQLRGSATR